MIFGVHDSQSIGKWIADRSSIVAPGIGIQEAATDGAIRGSIQMDDPPTVTRPVF